MAAPVSVVIPTFRRRAQLETTLRALAAADPPPAEILVHVDAGDAETAGWLRDAFPQIAVLGSQTRAGPGGGRNKLVAAARHDIVASFDDDSYPVDGDYFARLCEVFGRLPDASAVASEIFHRGEPVPAAAPAVGACVHFVGCGVAYRRGAFLESGGYVPLPVAYGMEELDLCIRFADRGKRIYFCPWLRVFHDTDRSHQAGAAITAGSIANVALLAYLRYPRRYWLYGAGQVASRIAWLIRARRFPGIMRGVTSIPAHLWRHRKLRLPVSAAGLAAFLRERAKPAALEPLSTLQGR